MRRCRVSPDEAREISVPENKKPADTKASAGEVGAAKRTNGS